MSHCEGSSWERMSISKCTQILAKFKERRLPEIEDEETARYPIDRLWQLTGYTKDMWCLVYNVSHC